MAYLLLVSAILCLVKLILHIDSYLTTSIDSYAMENSTSLIVDKNHKVGRFWQNETNTRFECIGKLLWYGMVRICSELWPIIGLKLQIANFTAALQNQICAQSRLEQIFKVLMKF